MKAAVALAGFLLLVTSWTGPATAEDEALLARVASELAARGGSLDDLPAVVPLYEFDFAAGEGTVTYLPLGEALARAGMEATLAHRRSEPGADGGEFHQAHLVQGDVFHACTDFVRHCYFFSPNSAGLSTPIDALVPHYNTVRAAYDGTPLPSVLSFPLKGAQVVYLRGQYVIGIHITASVLNFASPGHPGAGVSLENGLPGMGAWHFDRSMWGAGIGRLTYVAQPWGDDKVISQGTFRGYGDWTFCGTEYNPACVPAP